MIMPAHVRTPACAMRSLRVLKQAERQEKSFSDMVMTVPGMTRLSTSLVFYGTSSAGAGFPVARSFCDVALQGENADKRPSPLRR